MVYPSRFDTFISRDFEIPLTIGTHPYLFLLAFVGGAVYYVWYKKNVLDKVFATHVEISFPTLNIAQIEQAFEGGYDPALELVLHAKNSLENRHVADAIDEVDVGHGSWTNHLRRKEQDTFDRIIHGAETGQYFMILGCKVSPFYLYPCITYQVTFYAGGWKDDHDTGCNAS